MTGLYAWGDDGLERARGCGEEVHIVDRKHDVPRLFVCAVGRCRDLWNTGDPSQPRPPLGSLPVVSSWRCSLGKSRSPPYSTALQCDRRLPAGPIAGYWWGRSGIHPGGGVGRLSSALGFPYPGSRCYIVVHGLDHNIRILL